MTHTRHGLTVSLARTVLSLNTCIAEHAGEDCELVLSWTAGGRVREPRLQLRLPWAFDEQEGTT